MSSLPGNETAAVAERFFPGATFEQVDGRSWLLVATVDHRHFSVRQLDPGLPSTRVDIIHEFLTRSELRTATNVIRTERIGAQVFDARSWCPGTTAGDAIPLADWQSLHLPAAVDISRLGAIGRSLGEFHSTGTTSSLVARSPHFRIKDAIARTRRSLEWNERALAGEIRKESRARRWLTSSRSLLANAAANLELTGFLLDESLVMAHLDLWGSHIVDEPPTDPVFLDGQMVAAAPAVVDLAQLIARNGAWTDERVEQVLTAYTEVQPLSPLQRRLLPWLAALDAIASCGMLLARIQDDRRPLPEPARRAAILAIDQQLDLLQTLVTAFVPPPPRPRRRPGRKPIRS